MSSNALLAELAAERAKRRRVDEVIVLSDSDDDDGRAPETAGPSGSAAAFAAATGAGATAVTAVPGAAGPSTAGPSTAGPSTAGPSTAGPSAALLDMGFAPASVAQLLASRPAESLESYVAALTGEPPPPPAAATAAPRVLIDMGAEHRPGLVPFLDPRAIYVNSLPGATFVGGPHALPRSPRTISLADLCAGPVQYALFTVFDHDTSYIAARLPAAARLQLSCTPSPSAYGGKPVRFTPFRNVKYVFAERPPPRAGAEERTDSVCMHAKLFLLRFPDRLRVAVSSANSSRHDWEGVLQATWCYDFFALGRTVGDARAGRPAPSPFASYLAEFVERLTTLAPAEGAPWVRAILHEFVVDVPEGVSLVGSVPGDHPPPPPPPDMRTYGDAPPAEEAAAAPTLYGMSRLSELLRAQRRAFDDSDSILFQVSSLSSCHPGWRYPMAKAAQGGGGRADLGFVFPSRARILASGGYRAVGGLGHLCFAKANWWSSKGDATGYGLLRGCGPGCTKQHGSWAVGRHLAVSIFDLSPNPRPAAPANRRRYVNHSKMMVRSAASGRGWLLCGSANASGGAWGEEKKAGGAAVLRISLWELGVLLTDVVLEEYDLPFDRRARAYDAADDQPGAGFEGADM